MRNGFLCRSLSRQMQIHFFELPKMDGQEISELTSRLEKWAFFFKKEGTIPQNKLEEILLKGDPIMKQAHDSYDRFTADDRYIELYEARLKAERDRVTRERCAREDGFDEGILKNKQETARKMLKKGFDINDILELTGLSEEEINSIE